jgi:hypothetical protein
MLVAKSQPSRPTLRLSRGPWDRLAQRLTDYAPTIVILVARKAPRIREALRLEFAPTAIVVSDLALPFFAASLHGARVAVVDDFVNVGSTVRRAVRAALDAGASDVRAFAISHLEREKTLEELDVEYVSNEPLDMHGLQTFARRIPEALQSLAKPYDLDFPLLSCSLQPPFDSYDDLHAALRDRHGDRVYGLTTQAGADAGVRRLAVDPPRTKGRHEKVRSYVDELTGSCTLVPMVVSSPLPAEPPVWLTGWPRGVWDTMARLAPAGREGEDALARLRLFVDSLDFGLRFVQEHSDILSLAEDPPFSLDDAELVFGPAIRLVEPATAQPSGEAPAGAVGLPSPFLEAARRNGLVDEVRARGRGYPLEAFAACFEVLAGMVGAVEVEGNALAWPVADAAGRDSLYQRLRIGPTIPDLVCILSETCDPTLPSEIVRRQVTRLLDRFIDAGAVVPTTTRYVTDNGEATYRIYRKGEPAARDPVLERALYAWWAHDRPLSPTRATKLMSVLAFERPVDDGVQVRPATRGNTLCLSDSVLGEPIEIAQYLRDTGQVERVSRPDDAT